MYGDDCFIDIGYLVKQCLNNVVKFVWYCVVDCIWNIDGMCTGIDCGFDYMV